MLEEEDEEGGDNVQGLVVLIQYACKNIKIVYVET